VLPTRCAFTTVTKIEQRLDLVGDDGGNAYLVSLEGRTNDSSVQDAAAAECCREARIVYVSDPHSTGE